MIRLLGFLSLLFAFSALPACDTLKQCELGKLPQAEQDVISEVTAIAVEGASDWQNQLEGLGARLIPGQLECVAQAVIAAWSSPRAALVADRRAAIGRLQTYLGKHPKVSCGPRPAVSAAPSTSAWPSAKALL